MSPFVCLEDAKKDFEKKFREKTKNKWEEREHFVAHPNKYTLIEVQGEAETQEAVMKVGWGSGGRGKGLPARLPAWQCTLKYWHLSRTSTWAFTNVPPFPRCEHPAQLLLPTQAFSLQVDGGPVRTVVKPCSLDPATQKLITNIFSKDMFKNAMTLMNLGEEGL